MSDVNVQNAKVDSTGTSLATGGTADTQKGDQKSTQTDGGDGNKPEWVGTLPKELQDKMSRYKEPTDVAKAYVELESRLGKSTEIPGANSSKEEWKKWFNRIGRPDSADGYELSSIERSDILPKDEEAENAFAKEMHDNGHTKEQARRMWKFLLEKAGTALKEQIKKKKEAMKNAETKLREDYGTDYAANKKLIDRVVKRFAAEDAREFLNEGIGDDPRMLRMLVSVGKAMSEDTLEGRHPGPTAGEKLEPGMLSYDKSPEMTGENRYRRLKK